MFGIRGRADLHLVITRWGQPEKVLAPGERAPWGKGIRVVAVTTRMIWSFGPWELQFSGGQEVVGGEVSLQIRDPLLLLGPWRAGPLHTESLSPRGRRIKAVLPV